RREYAKAVSSETISKNHPSWRQKVEMNTARFTLHKRYELRHGNSGQPAMKQLLHRQSQPTVLQRDQEFVYFKLLAECPQPVRHIEHLFAQRADRLARMMNKSDQVIARPVAAATHSGECRHAGRVAINQHTS